MAIRIVLVLALIAGAADVALAASVTGRSALELQTQAFEWMGRKNYPKARTALEEAYDMTRPEGRNRALVVNRAILDVTQKTVVVRGIGDLTAYLAAHPAQDEPATNILGGALNLAASDVVVVNGPIWQAGFHEWDRRNEALDTSRPGYRRWGAVWVTDDIRRQIQAKQDERKQDVADQQDVVKEAGDYIIDLYQRENPDPKSYAKTVDDSNPLSMQISDPNLVWRQSGSTIFLPVFNAHWQSNIFTGGPTPQMKQAMDRYRRELNTLQALQAKVLRPNWPTRFEGVDPNGAEANAPPGVATTAPSQP